MKSKWLWALLVVVLGVSVYVGNVLATPSPGQSTTTLAKATVDDLDLSGKALTTAIGRTASRIRTASGSPGSRRTGSPTSTSSTTSSPRTAGRPAGTRIRGRASIFVVAGTVTNYTSDDPSCAPHTYTAGQSLVDPGGDDMHMLRNEDPAFPRRRSRCSSCRRAPRGGSTSRFPATARPE